MDDLGEYERCAQADERPQQHAAQVKAQRAVGPRSRAVGRVLGIGNIKLALEQQGSPQSALNSASIRFNTQ